MSPAATCGDVIPGRECFDFRPSCAFPAEGGPGRRNRDLEVSARLRAGNQGCGLLARLAIPGPRLGLPRLRRDRPAGEAERVKPVWDWY
jgi:hypothetical protein